MAVGATGLTDALWVLIQPLLPPPNTLPVLETKRVISGHHQWFEASVLTRSGASSGFGPATIGHCVKRKSSGSSRAYVTVLNYMGVADESGNTRHDSGNAYLVYIQSFISK